MFSQPITAFEPGPGYLGLKDLPILTDPNDDEGIHLAVDALACDLASVTGQKPEVWTTVTGRPHVEGLILIGSLPRCRFLSDIQTADQATSPAYNSISGMWESFETSICNSPWPVADRVFVISGSDKRGTIFGVYTLSEQIGVSPWFWWADVAVQPREQVYALPVTVRQGEPSVQYRGIFINDEAPALRDWARDKFGPQFNAEFYTKVFELLLRLKANFLWPAMWSGYPEPGSSFFTDDPANQALADRYGIVVSTSHHEPMQRSMTEWHVANKGLKARWRWDEQNKPVLVEHFKGGAARAKPYESVITLGMRGDTDKALDMDDPVSTMQDIVTTQRKILGDVYGSPENVPQVMALYKEVQSYYEQGLDIPDDVTLLFADDNFGHIRRLPTPEEQQRRGGCGVYYHLEYVGHPRSYKWMNTNSCGKIHQQLTQAFDSGIKKLWIINVGDIKPLEVPLTFALSLAWDIKSIAPEMIPAFYDTFAARTFGSEYSSNIGRLLLNHDRLLALRRLEHIESDTFSILNYNEADDIIQRLTDHEEASSALMDTLPEMHKAAFFQLVHYPLRAARVFVDLHISLAKNQLYGEQRRNTTNAMAMRVLALFDLDHDLTQQFHNSPWTGDKWNHIMKQPRYGFGTNGGDYHTPSRDLVRGLSFVQSRQDSTPIAGQMGVAVEGHIGILPGLANEECCRMQPSRGGRASGLRLPSLSPYGRNSCYFEVYCRGTRPVSWSVEASSYKWLCISPSSGTLESEATQDQRVSLIISDWSRVPAGLCTAIDIGIRSTDGDYEEVHLPVDNRRVPASVSAFVESDGCVSIAVGDVSLSEFQKAFYQHLPYLGRLSSGAISLASRVPDPNTLITAVPHLTYSVFTFTAAASATVTLYFTMALNARADGRPLAYDLIVDNTALKGAPLAGRSHSADLPEGWDTAVQDLVWTRCHAFDMSVAGLHTIRYRPLAQGVILEKIVVDLGGQRQSYLGPPGYSPVQGRPVVRL
ncbi:hypothetical protein SBRCBS47491_001480 [Sporothrix bragantina]|uniref:Gylcosyl hydrolase 115 C-terminal domain-containing protein n=1 Tax=Sporothrix bragantina TaxID=671064 RepID=A0ABP0AYZ7_9PEZI